MNETGGRSRPIVVFAIIAFLLAVMIGVVALRPGASSNSPVVANAPNSSAVSAATASSAPSVSAPDTTPPPTLAPIATSPPTPEPTPTPAGKPAVAVHGRVLAESTKQPLEGAQVSLIGLLSILDLNSIPKPIVSVRTASDGSFSIESFRRYNSEFAGAATFVRVEAEHYASIVQVFEASKGDNFERDFLLPDGDSIRGSVEDKEGKPIGGAILGAILLAEADPDQIMKQNAPVRSVFALSSSDGSFVLDGLARGESLRIPVRAAGFAPKVEGPLAAGATGVRIVLEPATARLYGKVTDAAEHPVAGARVMVLGMAAMMGMPKFADVLSHAFGAETDRNGAYNITALPAGMYMAMLLPPPESDAEPQEPVQVAIAEGQAVEKNFVLGGGEVITGHAIDAETGKGLAGVRLSSEPYGDLGRMANAQMPAPGQRKVEVITGNDGAFKVATRRIGGARSFFFQPPDGYVAEPDPRGMPQGMCYLEESALSAPYELRFKHASMVSGVVLLPDRSAPAANAKVSWTPSQRAGFPPVLTDAEGKFRLATDGGDGTAQAKSDAGFAIQEIDVPPAGLDNVEIVLQKYGAITGRVTDTGKKPLADVTISIVSTRFGRPNDEMPFVKTAEDGTYYLDLVPPMELLATASPSKPDSYATVSKPLTLTSAEVKRDFDFVLGEGDALEGVVSNADGEPVAGVGLHATALISDTTTTAQSATTDKDGYYRITGLNANYPILDLRASHQDYKDTYEHNLSVLDNPHNITLERRTKYKLQAIGRDSGRPIAYYRYRVLRQSPSGIGLQIDHRNLGGDVKSEDGTTVIENLSDEWNRIDVTGLDAKGYPTALRGSSSHSPLQNSTETIVVKVGETKILRGKVVREDTKAPVGGVGVGILLPSLSSESAPARDPSYDPDSTTTNSSGSFELKGLMPGTCLLTISAKDAGLYPVREYIAAIPEEGQPDDLTIELSGGSTIFGRVIGFDGAPVAAAPVTLTAAGPGGRGDSPVALKTDREGTYRKSGIPPGQYMVELKSDVPPLKDSIWKDVPAGKIEVNFDFSETVHLTGAIQYNGGPLPQNLSFFLRPMGSAGIPEKYPSIERVGASNYESRVPPGRWGLQAAGMGVTGVYIAEQFDVPAQPREQTRNFNLDFVDIDVVVDGPESQSLLKTNVAISQRVDGVEYSGAAQDFGSSRRHFIGFPAGEYQAILRDEAGKFLAASDWTQVGKGRENVIVIFLGALKTIPIGNWTSDQVPDGKWSDAERVFQNFATLSWDATFAIQQARPGTIRVELQRDRDGAYLVTKRIVLKENGTVVGDTEERARYVSGGAAFQLAEIKPGAIYTAEATVCRMRDSQTHGTVVVIISPK